MGVRKGMVDRVEICGGEGFRSMTSRSWFVVTVTLVR